MTEKERRIYEYVARGYLARKANPDSRSDYLVADLCGQSPEIAMRDVRIASPEIKEKIDNLRFAIIRQQKRYAPSTQEDKEKMDRWKARAAALGLAALIAFAGFLANNIGKEEQEPRGMGEPAGFRQEMRVDVEQHDADYWLRQSQATNEGQTQSQSDYGER
ncbi:MAG: hypothetical protein IKP28_01920 [Clostridia bacterium]|nr:hypothetical protein [Clostridia bacterium]